MRRAEQPSRRVVLQRDRIVGVHRHQRHRYVLDERPEMPCLGFLVAAPRPQLVHDRREGTAEIREPGAGGLELETLRIIGEAHRVQEARHLAIRAAHVTPQFGDQQCEDDPREKRRAVVPGLQNEPGDEHHGHADHHEPQQQGKDEGFKCHAFPCGGKATRAPVPAPPRPVKY